MMGMPNENPYQSPQPFPLPPKPPDSRPWFMRPFRPANLLVLFAVLLAFLAIQFWIAIRH